MSDRLSVQNLRANTPPKVSRSLSGQPHPSSAAQRLSVGPRSSSLSNNLNSPSTANISNISKLHRGSSLKYELDNGAAGVEDPLEAARRILGKTSRRGSLSSQDNRNTEIPERPAELVSNIDFGGLSLEEFAGIARTERSAEPSDGNSTNKAISSELPVKDYNEEKDKYEDLHRSILACDEVLMSVESYLGNFQADLASVSAEIESLQTRSVSLSTRLENRKAVEGLLGPAVQNLSIPPAVVRKITEGMIDDNFETALAEIEKRTKNATAKSGERSYKASEDIKLLLENLQLKAVERIRDYLVSQIKALRSPGMNAQIVQQQAFIKYKSLYEYMARHHRQLADDILQAYVNTMRWHYQYNLMQYEGSLRKMRLRMYNKSDLLGATNTANAQKKPAQHGRNNSNANVGIRSIHDAFSLGQRINLLKNPSDKAITAYEAEEDQNTNNIEVPFHAFTQALIDNASWEYTVLTGLLSSVPSGIISASRAFTSIFEPIFSIGQSFTKYLVDETYDALGILLCIRLTQRAAFTLQRRRIPVVENYINATTMLLWPRLQQIMDAHCDSIRQIASTNSPAINSQQQQQSQQSQQQQHLSPNKSPPRPTLASSASAFLLQSTSSIASSLTSSSTSTDAAAASAAGMTNSTAPHPLTQRFARFTASILALSSSSASSSGGSSSAAAVDPAIAALAAEEPVTRSLSRLRTEFEACLFRLGHFLQVAPNTNINTSNHNTSSNSNSNSNMMANRNRRRDRFLENNYALVGTVLEGVEGRMAEEMRGYFEGLSAGLAGDVDADTDADTAEV